MPTARLTGERNDVALAGLNHKLGYRGIPNTLLNFGEGKFPVRARRSAAPVGAVGYRVGAPGEGLRCMFHMMNEARIAIGLGAVDAGLRRLRGQPATTRAIARRAGRCGPAARMPPSRRCASSNTPTSSACCWRRRLMSKARSRWCLYCARLVDEQHTGAPRGRARGGAAARGADADRQELAERVVPGGQQPGDPGARRLRLHARLSGRAVLARQPAEHDPRRHARHPGAGPARPQGRDGWRCGTQAARCAHRSASALRAPSACRRRPRPCGGVAGGASRRRKPRGRAACPTTR